MQKVVYSLVLSDDIVAAVDAIAAREGHSRSSLVDHILAEYTSMVSPRTRARQAADALERQTARFGFRSSLSQGGTLTLRTALRYKYNPSLAYTIEMKNNEGALGRLHVALRSQNEALLTFFRLFFELWGKLETAHLPGGAEVEAAWSGPQRYTRTLRRPASPLSGEEEGQAIAVYIGLLDSCMKVFFSHLNDAAAALRETEGQYLRTLDTNSLVAEL